MKTCEGRYQDIQPLMASERHEDAVNALEKILESFPDFAQGHNDLGILYHKLGNREKALDHLRESVDYEPKETTFLKNLADFYYSEMGDVKGALKYYQIILEINPHDIDALTISGHIAVSEHQFDDAKGFYKKVLDIEPWNDDAWKYLERLDEYDSSSKIDLQTEDAYHRCRELSTSGKNEAAIRELEKLLKINPDFALAYNDLGVLNYSLGNKEETLAYYEKAALLEPNNVVFQKNLADFYYVEMGRIEDALAIYVKVLSEEPADVDCLMAAGHISETLGRTNDAVIFYDRVLDIEPWNIEAGEKNDELSKLLHVNNENTAQDHNFSTIKTGLEVSFEKMELD